MSLVSEPIQKALLILLLCLSFITQSMAGVMMSCDDTDMSDMDIQTDMKMSTAVSTRHLSMQKMTQTERLEKHSFQAASCKEDKSSVHQECHQCVCVLAPCSTPVLTHQLSTLKPLLLLLSRFPPTTAQILSPVTASLYKPPIGFLTA